MKLAILKVLSLLVFLGGVVIVGLILEDGNPAGFFTQRYDAFLNAVATGGEDAAAGTRGSLRSFGIASGLAMLLVGLYGFVPKLRGRKASFTYQSSAGEVTIQLDTVERSLQRVLSKMAEIRKVRVQLSPASGGKAVQVRAWATLLKPERISARATTERVHRFIEITAKEHLGLEELAPIALCVDFEMNPKASERALRTRVQSEDRAATVIAPTSVVAAVEDEMVVEEMEESPEAEAEALTADSGVPVDWAACAAEDTTQPPSEEEPPGALDEMEGDPAEQVVVATALDEEARAPFTEEPETEDCAFDQSVPTEEEATELDHELRPVADDEEVIPLPAPDDYRDDLASDYDDDFALPQVSDGEPEAESEEEEGTAQSEDKDKGTLPPFNY